VFPALHFNRLCKYKCKRLTNADFGPVTDSLKCLRWDFSTVTVNAFSCDSEAPERIYGGTE